LPVPKFQGADPNVTGDWTIARTRHGFFPKQFSGNESYGSFNAGLEAWNLAGATEIDRQIVWNNRLRAINAWYMGRITIVDPQILLVPDKSNSMGIGANGNNGFTDIHVVSGRIHGAATGIMVNPRSHSTINGVELANALNILVRYAREKSGGDPLLEIIDPVFISGVKVKMQLDGLPTRTIVGKQTTLLTLSGQKYQIYYQEQHADYIVPKTTRSVRASPEEGLTNQQNWEMYGIAIAGAVAPNTAVVMDGIVGLAHRL
jgi:hypothetical protein